MCSIVLYCVFFYFTSFIVHDFQIDTLSFLGIRDFFMKYSDSFPKKTKKIFPENAPINYLKKCTAVFMHLPLLFRDN